MIEQIFSGSSYQAVKQMLDLCSQRQEALAGNIANVETPGFRRMDLDQGAVATFQAAMQNAANGGQVDAAAAAGIRTLPDPLAQSTRGDGNNVNIDQELLAMSKNTVEYGALSEFAGSNLKLLKTAISGNVT